MLSCRISLGLRQLRARQYCYRAVGPERTEELVFHYGGLQFWSNVGIRGNQCNQGQRWPSAGLCTSSLELVGLRVIPPAGPRLESSGDRTRECRSRSGKYAEAGQRVWNPAKR